MSSSKIREFVRFFVSLRLSEAHGAWRRSLFENTHIYPCFVTLVYEVIGFDEHYRPAYVEIINVLFIFSMALMSSLSVGCPRYRSQ